MDLPRNAEADHSRRLRIPYVIGLCIVGISVLICHVSLVLLMGRHADGAHLVNTSGRQRMLSQRMSKLALMIERAPSASERERLQAALRSSRRQWLSTHDLLRDAASHARWSDGLRRSMAMLQSDVDTMALATAALTDPKADTQTRRAATARLLDHEWRFLRTMERAVGQFDDETIDHVRHATILAGVSLVVIMVVLIAEALLIYRPAERQYARYITALDGTRGALARSVENLHRLVSVLPDITFVFDGDGRYREVFTSRPDLLVQPADKLVGQLMQDMVPADLAEFFMEHIRTTIADGRSRQFDYSLPVAAGLTCFRATTSLLEPALEHERLVVLFVRDVTADVDLERLRDEQEQRVLQAIIDAQEQERARIAHDLHDDLGQQIALVKLLLSSIDYRNEDAERRRQVIDGVDNLATTIRSIARGLAPAALRSLGLEDAVREDCERVRERSGITIELSTYLRRPRLSAQIELCLYRIVQELLTNTIRHADARSISLQLVEHGTSVVLTYEDDGRGFDPAVTTDGSGLIGIRSRTHVKHGTFHLDTMPGRGTHVTVELPLEQE